jgi:hypothetical protein
MDKRLSEILAGGLGHFWVLEGSSVGELDDENARSGFIRRVGDAVEVHTLSSLPAEATLLAREEEIPQGVIAVTEHSGAMLLDVSGTSSSYNIGGSRASVTRFKGATLIVHPRMLDAKSTRLYSVSGHFQGHGLLSWADFNAIERSFTTDSLNRLQSAQINLKPTTVRKINLTPTTELHLDAHWEFADDADLQHVVRTSLEIMLVSRHPVEFRSLLLSLFRCQELLSIAFGGLLRVQGGRAVLEGTDTRGYLWNAQLMPESPPHGVPIASANARPLFHLNDIKGLDGVARWVRLCKKHPRAVSPIVNRYRLGPSSDAVRLLEIASAIEFWVARHRRTSEWARSGGNFAEALAIHVGKPFDDWCGDTKKWARKFWAHYNGLKHHIATFDPDPLAVKALQESGYLVLVADLLNRIGQSKKPAGQIFGSHQYDDLKRWVHDVLGT